MRVKGIQANSVKYSFQHKKKIYEWVQNSKQFELRIDSQFSNLQRGKGEYGGSYFWTQLIWNSNLFDRILSEKKKFSMVFELKQFFGQLGFWFLNTFGDFIFLKIG